MIVVTAPYGKVGSKLLPRLLTQNLPVRAIASDPGKLDAATRARVDVVQGSMDDPAVLDRACAGADALFLLVPPPVTAASVVDHYRRFSEPAAAAVAKHGVARVVAISGLYHGGPETGPLYAVTAMGEAFARTDAAYRAIWSANHMENLLRQVEPIRKGFFAMPVPPSAKMPLVAVDDVAAISAELLADAGWTGHGGVAAMGPEDVSHDEVAATISDVLGRPVRFQAVSEQDFIAQMTGRGASLDVAEWLRAMFRQGGESPHGNAPRHGQGATPTSFRDWCGQVLKPAVEG